MDSAAFKAKLAEAEEADDMRGQWWQLVYNEQCAPAVQWFSERGWDAQATTLTDYLQSLGRSAPTEDAEVTNMIDSVSLVSAVKR